MKVSDLMKDRTLKSDFTGYITNDDWVLAVSNTEDAEVANYVVAQMGVAGLDAQMNPVTQDKQYIRAGQSTTKTGTQRTFKVSGDRYAGDEFQDMCFAHEMKYGTGQSVIVDYVYFNIITGKGEKGKASIIVNSDGSGNSGESSAVDIDVKKAGEQPKEFTYTPPAAPPQG